MAASLPEQLQALLALQRIDTQIARAKRAQTGLDNGTQADAAAQAALTAAQSATAAAHKAQGELKDSELKLAAVEAKRKSYHQKLYQGTTSNAKELANMEKEIEALGRQQSDLDTRILELMERAEQAQAEAHMADARAKEAAQKHTDTVAQFRSRYETLALEITDAMRQRADAAAAVPDKALLKRYDDLRAKSAGVGIAPILDGDCGGCHMKLPSAVVKLVKEAQAVQTCENCGRLLTL